MNSKQAVIGYFKFKSIENMGYLKYGYFKRIIQYVVDCYNEYYVRKIFLQLVEENYFIKIKNHKHSYKYKFNPKKKHKLDDEEEDMNPKLPIIISWD